MCENKWGKTFLCPRSPSTVQPVDMYWCNASNWSGFHCNDKNKNTSLHYPMLRDWLQFFLPKREQNPHQFGEVIPGTTLLFLPDSQWPKLDIQPPKCLPDPDLPYFCCWSIHLFCLLGFGNSPLRSYCLQCWTTRFNLHRADRLFHALLYS